jgi:hypothetical protein
MLAEFSGYSKRQCVRNWVINPANTVNRAFMAILTGTTKPEVWLSWGAGLAVIAHGVRHGWREGRS